MYRLAGDLCGNERSTDEVEQLVNSYFCAMREDGKGEILIGQVSR